MSKKFTAKTLLAKILTVKNEPVKILYECIDTVARRYELTFEQVMSILMNYREDIHSIALKQKYISPLEKKDGNK